MTAVLNLIIALLPIAFNWLLTLLKAKAASIKPTGNNAADAHALLAAVLADIPSFHLFRRGLVRILMLEAPKAIAESTGLDPAVVTEFIDLATHDPHPDAAPAA